MKSRLVLLVVCALLRVVTLFHPCLSDDEATYAVVGREMLSGHVLYRDIVDHKPPAIYALNAATQALGGPTGGMVLLHALNIVIVWLTALLLGGILRKHSKDPRVPFVGALFWIVFSTFYIDADSLAVNCELPMMLPIVGSVVAFLRGRLLVTGLLVGVAAMFKYQAGVQIALYAVAWAVAERRHPGRLLAGLLALGLGALAPIVAAVLVLWRAGGLEAAFFWFRFNFAYVQTGFASVDVLGRMAVSIAGVVVPSFLLYGLGLREAFVGLREGDDFRRFVVGWLAISAFAVGLGGRFFGHYFHQIAAPLVVLAAPAAVRLLDRRPAWFAFGTLVPAAAFFALTFVHDRMMVWAGEPDPDYASVVRWLDARAPRSEALCIWGNSPVLYFDAERPLGCRFVFANYLTGLSPATRTQTDPAFDASANVVPVAWDMLIADLATRKPRFIVDGSPGNVGFYGKFPPEKFPRLWTTLEAEYEPKREVSGMLIWERRSP